jgi:hypothetical protein
MKKFEIISAYFVILIFFVLSFVPTQNAFGHGIGAETLPPVTVGGRNASIELSISPPVFDPTNPEQRIVVRFFDADTDAVIEHVTYIIELAKDKERIFRYMFHDEIGNLILKINSTDSKEITIHGSQNNLLGGWMSDGINPVTLEGPIFSSGGLYEFNIDILTLDKDSKILDERVTFTGGISVADKTSYNVIGHDKKQYGLGITSWYDKINDFDYDTENSNVSFTMPFDWSQKNIEQITTVHEELQISKSFPDLLVTKYDVSVNGVPLSENSIVTDDFSDDNRTVHMVLTKQELLSIRDVASKVSDSKMLFSITPSQNVVLPLSHVTNLQYQVDLWWDPTTIESNMETKFFTDITELYVASKQVKPTNYDFVLKQNGTEFFRQTVNGQLNTSPKSNLQKYVFSDKEIGPILVSIENIGGNSLASTNFMVVVNPEKIEKQEFPIRQPSSKSDGSEGNYLVDITWFSSPLQIYEQSEFILTIYDKETLLPVYDAKYDFVLVTDSQEIFRKSGLASAGGSFENYRFAEKDLGSATLRIENINNSGEFVELPINVTPEFPLGVILILPVFLFGIILFCRLKNIPKIMVGA